MRIKWLNKAIRNMEDAALFMARDNPLAAAQMAAHIEQRVLSLKDHPAKGRPGRVLGTRELVIGRYPYIIPYKVINQEIIILRVFHTSQKQPLKW